MRAGLLLRLVVVLNLDGTRPRPARRPQTWKATVAREAASFRMVGLPVVMPAPERDAHIVMEMLSAKCQHAFLSLGERRRGDGLDHRKG